MKLPIVDENDVEIGLKERDHLAEGDIYRVTALWLTNSKGDILIAQRAFTKRHDPGKWGPAVAGTVEEGETYETSIVKEIEEELGVSMVLSDLRKGPKIKKPGHNAHFGQWYLATLDKSIDEFDYQKEEVVALRWISPAALRQSIQNNPEDFVSSIPYWIDTFLPTPATVL